MDISSQEFSRRRFMAAASAAATGLVSAPALLAAEDRPAPERQAAETLAADKDKALIAMTLDLEMSMHYPKWGYTEWNYVKGNLDEPTKRYVVEACRRVKAKGGVIHCFLLGRTLEQENVDWLKEIIGQGHPVGNHTYDHVSLWAAKRDDLQYRFQRAPWLIHGKSVPEVLEENIRLTEMAMKTRLGVMPVGFRTPGGNLNALHGREDLQKMLRKLGYAWVSSSSFRGSMEELGIKLQNPGDADFQAVVDAQKVTQPFVYPTGLVEVPMSPLGDVASFRRQTQKWKTGDFLKMLERCIRWTIEQRAVFDLLSHPSIMQWEDPKFEAYELICDMVNQSGGKAAIVGLDTIAKRAQLRHAAASRRT
jgi:peptidoglycan/xylan/chitin deacetylase (PgdA/CDA1 family)